MTVKKKVDLRKGLRQTVEVDAKRVGPLLSEAVRACAILHAIGALYPEAKGVRAVNRSLHRAIARLVEHDDETLLTDGSRGMEETK